MEVSYRNLNKDNIYITYQHSSMQPFAYNLGKICILKQRKEPESEEKNMLSQAECEKWKEHTLNHLLDSLGSQHFLHDCINLINILQNQVHVFVKTPKKACTEL